MTLTLAHIQIGWISALPIEALLAEIMLDELIEQTIPLPPNDNNIYTYGRIKISGSDASHIVAIAQLPLSTPGKSSTATVANNMRRTFPHLKFGIMVGIAGGVWTAKDDLRLGDIVVGVPDDGGPGIIQYDLGKSVQEREFILKGTLNRAPDVLRTAAGMLRRKHMRWPGDYVSILENEEVKRHAPHPSVDSLFCPTYLHRGGHTCEGCDTAHLRARPTRADSTPKIHYGAIASGDQVIKDATMAEMIRKTHNIMCFEMEAAGLDAFPCLVIRGISDYADTHKNDDLHAYAAATAAAYAKELLAVVPVTAVAEHPSTGNTHWNVPRAPNPLFTGRKKLLSDMKKHLVTETSKKDRPVFVLQGIGGAGKSEVAVRFAMENQDDFWGIFWIDADNEQSVEQGFMAIAKMPTPPLNSTTPKDVLQWLASIKESWLLILDNCDDADIDFSRYIPSRGGSVIVTTRLTECKGLGIWANLDDLGSDAATQLLLGACGYEMGDHEAHKPAVEAVVSSLGQHALALVHAGAYIQKRLCTLDEYVHLFCREQTRLMKFRPKQQASRYGSVFATFEVSAGALASSEDEDCELALRLLDVLAFLNREAVEEDIFSRAFDECHKLEKEWKNNGMNCPKCPRYYAIPSRGYDQITEGSSRLDKRSSLEYDKYDACNYRACLTGINNATNSGLPGSCIFKSEHGADASNDESQIDHLHMWHCEKVRSSKLVEHQTTTRLRIARIRLADLSLIRIDGNKVSMHPLAHEWARTRLNQTARRHAWEQTVSLLALSAVGTVRWYAFTPMLAPHIGTCFHSRDQEETRSQLSLTVAQALYRLAWQLYYDSKYQLSLSVFETLSSSSKIQPHVCSLVTHGSLQGVSWCLSQLGRHKEARDVANHMVQSMKKRYGKVSSNAFDWQLRLAALHMKAGDPQGAVTLLERLYESYSQLSILENSQMKNLLWILVQVHETLGNSKQAMVFAEHHFQLCKTFSISSEFRLHSLVELCERYIVSGQAEKAVNFLEDHISFCCTMSLPKSHMVLIMMTLVQAYIGLNRLNRAMPCLATLHFHSAELSTIDLHPAWLARRLGLLAETYLDLKEFRMAATALEEQINLDSSYVPLDDTLRLQHIRSLALVYLNLEDSQKTNEAVILLEEVMDKGRETLHADVEQLEYTESLLAQAQEKLAQATRTQQSVVDINDQQSSQEEAATQRPASVVSENDTLVKQDSHLSIDPAQTHQNKTSGYKRKHETMLGRWIELDRLIASGKSDPRVGQNRLVKRRKISDVQQNHDQLLCLEKRD